MGGISIWQLLIVVIVIAMIYGIYRVITSSPSESGIHDTTKISRWVVWLLYGQVAVSSLALISGALEYQLLTDFQKGIYTSQELAVQAGEANDSRQSAVGSIQFLVFLVSGILILRWIYLSSYNTHQVGASGLQFTPGWSIGWYFIPFANLWKPYQAMKEIWRVSSNPTAWESVSAPALLGGWWFFWIVSNLFSNASFRLTMSAEDLDALIQANVVTQISDVASIPLSLIVVAIVKNIHRMQSNFVHAQAGA